MFFKKIHRFFPFSKLVKVLFLLSLGMQLIVLSQMYFYKVDFYTELSQLLVRLFRGTLLSFIAAALLAYPYISLTSYLNEKIPWRRNFFKRLILQFTVSVLAGLVITPIIVIPAGLVFSMEYDLQTNLNNTYYIIFLSMFLMVILEAIIYFEESRRAGAKAENLEKELSQIKFEVLKSQINPHFMFNSLNVLSGLINKDVKKAQQFIDEFSMIYRYVLETIEQPVATLGKELEFMRSYLFLQQIRYGKNLTYTVNITADLMELFLPPLSLQVVLENAVKHNIVNESKPLHIEISNEKFTLVVKNNIQSKISKGVSTGLGLKNLIRRYELVSNMIPEFKIDTNHYIAILPLIKVEENERSNN